MSTFFGFALLAGGILLAIAGVTDADILAAIGGVLGGKPLPPAQTRSAPQPGPNVGTDLLQPFFPGGIPAP